MKKLNKLIFKGKAVVLSKSEAKMVMDSSDYGGYASSAGVYLCILNGNTYRYVYNYPDGSPCVIGGYEVCYNVLGIEVCSL
ncbi:MAG: hypothetical protein LBC19_14160 [Tannerella sp.]|jgi:hypothetical protein|nr:hypothetical protein [Tannerella sp.]